MRDNVVAVDIGGTKTAVALLNQDLEILTLKTFTTKKEKEPFIRALISEIKQLGAYQAVGIAVAGTVDPSGTIIAAPNIPLGGVNFKEILAKKLKTQVFLDNDANLAAVGEKLKGAAKQFQSFVLLTVGTGIGGGIFINGQLYRGSLGAAGEVGHMIIQADGPQCSCGRFGCLEALASGTALEKAAEHFVNSNPQSALALALKKTKQKLDGRLLAELAKTGNAEAVKLWQRVGYYLGIGLGSLINIFNPEAVLLGGGLLAEEKLFLNTAKKTAAATVLDSRARETPVIKARLGQKAGLIGAAGLALSHGAPQ